MAEKRDRVPVEIVRVDVPFLDILVMGVKIAVAFIPIYMVFVLLVKLTVWAIELYTTEAG